MGIRLGIGKHIGYTRDDISCDIMSTHECRYHSKGSITRCLPTLETGKVISAFKRLRFRIEKPRHSHSKCHLAVKPHRAGLTLQSRDVLPGTVASLALVEVGGLGIESNSHKDQWKDFISP